MTSKQEQQLRKRIRHNENHRQTLHDAMNANIEEQSRLAREHYALAAQINQANKVIHDLHSELMESWGGKL